MDTDLPNRPMQRTGNGTGLGLAAVAVALLVVGACLVAYSHLDGATAAHHAQWVRAEPLAAAAAVPLAPPATLPSTAVARPVADGPLPVPAPAERPARRRPGWPAPARAPPALSV